MFFLQTHSCSLHKMLNDGLECVDYCDVFISCLDSPSDGTHSLQRIHWWTSDAMLHFSKFVFWWRNLKASKFSANIIFGWTIPLVVYRRDIFTITDIHLKYIDFVLTKPQWTLDWVGAIFNVMWMKIRTEIQLCMLIVYVLKSLSKHFQLTKNYAKRELWNMTVTTDNVKYSTERTFFHSHQIKNIGNILQ